MVGLGRACLLGDFFAGTRRWLGGLGFVVVVDSSFSLFFFGDAARRILARRDGRVMGR